MEDEGGACAPAKVDSGGGQDSRTDDGNGSQGARAHTSCGGDQYGHAHTGDGGCQGGRLTVKGGGSRDGPVAMDHGGDHGGRVDVHGSRADAGPAGTPRRALGVGGRDELHSGAELTPVTVPDPSGTEAGTNHVWPRAHLDCPLVSDKAKGASVKLRG